MSDPRPWPHGDVSDAELRGAPELRDDWLDFAVNVDPYGPHPDVDAAFREAAVHRYPDPQYRELRLALATRDDHPYEGIAVGPGTTSLLWTLMRTLARETPSPLRVVVAEPTFAEYRAAAEDVGARIHGVPRRLEDDFQIDPAALVAAIDEARPDVVILGQPHNPSGRLLPRPIWPDLADAYPHCTFILDEAFLRLSHGHGRVFDRTPPNVWRLRSLTKELGFPGLRVGYVVAEPDRLERLRRAQPPWEVGHPASEAARIGVRTPSWVDAVRDRMLADTDALAAMLRGDGWRVLPSDSVFVMVEVDDASTLRTKLRAHGILVRDCTSFGLPTWMRLCGRPRRDRDRLRAALREALERAPDRVRATPP